MNKELYKMKVTVVKALANPIRLMIVDCLRDGEKNVTEIVKIIKEEQSTVSKNLGILRAHDIIQDRKIGLNVYYSLKICCIDKFLNGLDKLLIENLAQKQELINSYKGEVND